MSKVQQHINTTHVQKTSYNKHVRMLKKKKKKTHGKVYTHTNETCVRTKRFVKMTC